jgi:hypothetical protein
MRQCWECIQRTNLVKHDLYSPFCTPLRFCQRNCAFSHYGLICWQSSIIQRPLKQCVNSCSEFLRMSFIARLDLSASRACTIHVDDIEYFFWFVTNPHLFGSHPSAYMVSLNRLYMTRWMLKILYPASCCICQHHGPGKSSRGRRGRH